MSEVPAAGGRPKAILAILTGVLALSYVDRYLLAILIEPIRADLGLSDGQIGLLTGFAFSAFYAAVGLPLARYADRGHRRAWAHWVVSWCGRQTVNVVALVPLVWLVFGVFR